MFYGIDNVNNVACGWRAPNYKHTDDDDDDDHHHHILLVGVMQVVWFDLRVRRLRRVADRLCMAKMYRLCGLM